MTMDRLQQLHSSLNMQSGKTFTLSHSTRYIVQLLESKLLCIKRGVFNTLNKMLKFHLSTLQYFAGASQGSVKSKAVLP